MRYNIKRDVQFVDLQKTITDSTATILTWTATAQQEVNLRGKDSAPDILRYMRDPNLVFLGHINRTE